MDLSLIILTGALVGLTGWYAKLTRDISKSSADSAQAAQASAQHAARAIDATERSTLAQAMPVLIIRWAHSTIKQGQASVEYTVHNVGKSTALNGLLSHRDQERKLPAIEPGRQQPAVAAVPGEIVDGTPRPAGTVMIIYEDAIGNRIKTECRPATGPDHAMYETSLWLAGGWKKLKAT